MTKPPDEQDDRDHGQPLELGPEYDPHGRPNTKRARALEHIARLVDDGYAGDLDR